jgi:hypothetical protein
MSLKSKRINKKTATTVTVNSSSSLFAQFPRIVRHDGISSPAPATTIPQAFQEQQAFIGHTAAWHAEVRQKIIDTIASLPGAPLVSILEGLPAVKLATHALSLFKTENLTGVFGSADHPVQLEQLLLEFQLSAPTKYQSDTIHRSINNKLAWIESELLAQALTQDHDHHFPPLSPVSSTAVVNVPQSSIIAQSSLKRPRDVLPLELVPTKDTRLTQFNLSTQSVPPQRLPSQRPIKATNFFGDRIQANVVQQLATSSLGGLPQQRSSTSGSAPVASSLSPGRATSTRPGSSGPDMRPGIVSARSSVYSAPSVVPSAQPIHNVSVPVSSASTHNASPVGQSRVQEPRVIPPSLFLSADNSSADSPLPIILSASTTIPANDVSSATHVDHRDSQDGSIDDSLGPYNDNDDIGNNSIDHPPVDDSLDSINPRDPSTPCNVTFGQIYDLHKFMI